MVLVSGVLACEGGHADPQRVPLSAEAERARSQGRAVIDALRPIHAAMPDLDTLAERPCPRLDARAFNISWGQLNHMLTGQGIDAHARHTGDPLPFNDNHFARPEHFRGEQLGEAEPSDLERITKAYELLDAVGYVRVAKVQTLTPPSLDPGGEMAFEPGAVTGWLVVFDRDAEVVCAVSATVESSDAVSITRPGNETVETVETVEDAERRAVANEAALMVDLTRQLSGALREAAKPTLSATSTTSTSPPEAPSPTPPPTAGE